MNYDLGNKKCKPCEGGVKPFTREQAQQYVVATPGWQISEDGKNIHRQYKFPNFAKALAFVNTVGTVAEAESHHPDITLGWGRVGIELSSHAIKGLSENDFILAYKIDHPPA